MLVAEDLGLIMDKTVKLEWHKLSNTRTRCLRITQVRALLCTGNTACTVLTAMKWRTARALNQVVLQLRVTEILL